MKRLSLRKGLAHQLVLYCSEQTLSTVTPGEKGFVYITALHEGKSRQDLKTGTSTGTEAETVEEHCWLSHSVCISFCKRRSTIKILGRCSSVGGVLYEQAWGPKVDAQHHVNRACWHQPHYNHSFQEHLQLHKEFKVSRGIHEAVSQ